MGYVMWNAHNTMIGSGGRVKNQGQSWKIRLKKGSGSTIPQPAQRPVNNQDMSWKSAYLSSTELTRQPDYPQLAH